MKGMKVYSKCRTYIASTDPIGPETLKNHPQFIMMIVKAVQVFDGDILFFLSILQFDTVAK